MRAAITARDLPFRSGLGQSKVQSWTLAGSGAVLAAGAGIIMGGGALTLGAPAVNACDLACRLAAYQAENGYERVDSERGGDSFKAESQESGCDCIDSPKTDHAPVQVTDRLTPNEKPAVVKADKEWERPSGPYSYVVLFHGHHGERAVHEGVDYVHSGTEVPVVDIFAAAEGRVSYVRKGCQESSRFGVNRIGRECGAGWGNHVVIDHGNGIHSRYAHLADEDILVRTGDAVKAGERIAGMGNSGRSQERHLHFEIGHVEKKFDSCGPVRSFDRIFDPADFLKGNTR